MKMFWTKKYKTLGCVWERYTFLFFLNKKGLSWLNRALKLSACRTRGSSGSAWSIFGRKFQTTAKGAYIAGGEKKITRHWFQLLFLPFRFFFIIIYKNFVFLFPFASWKKKCIKIKVELFLKLVSRSEFDLRLQFGSRDVCCGMSGRVFILFFRHWPLLFRVIYIFVFLFFFFFKKGGSLCCEECHEISERAYTAGPNGIITRQVAWRMKRDLFKFHFSRARAHARCFFFKYFL
jgi:hypothetical protein